MTPLNLVTSVSTREKPTATFSRAMDSTTITSMTFTLEQGAATVPGAVTWAAATNTATFTPSAALGNNLLYTATVTTGAKDPGGGALAANHTWRFTTTPLELGSASTYSVLGGSVTNTGLTTLGGDLGVSPGTSIVNFPPGTSSGAKHAGDSPAAQARLDLIVAYNDAAARTSTSPVAGDIAGRTFNAGVHTAAAAITMSTPITLDGQANPNAVFIFQIDAAFDTAASTSINLINGARAANVYWQVSGAVTLGATSSFTGTVLGFAAITVGANASVTGRVLTPNGLVTLSTNAIVNPAP